MMTDAAWGSRSANRHSAMNFRDSNFNLNPLIWVYVYWALSTHEALLKASGISQGDMKAPCPLLFMRCYLVITHQRIIPPQDQRNKSELLTTVQWLSHVRFSATPWTAARQASLSFTISQRLLKLMSTESVMPSSHLILCRPLLLLPAVFPSIRVFSSKSAHLSSPSLDW